MLRFVDSWQWCIWLSQYWIKTGKSATSLIENEYVSIVLIYTYAREHWFYIFRQLFRWNPSGFRIATNTAWHRIRLFIPNHVQQARHWQQSEFTQYHTDSFYITQFIRSHQNLLYWLTRGGLVATFSIRGVGYHWFKQSWRLFGTRPIQKQMMTLAIGS